MTKNYSKEKNELKEPDQSVIDFILNFSKALHVSSACNLKSITILN